MPSKLTNQKIDKKSDKKREYENVLTDLRDSAVQAALASGKILRDGFTRRLHVSTKAGAGLVTQIDLASEKTAIRILKKNHPSFGFLAEESGTSATRASVNNPEGRWILDPLDGTTNYVHRYPMFCVSIGAEWKGEIVVGVIYHPILDDLYVAVKGRGAFLAGKPLKVSRTAKLSDALLTTGFTYQKRHWLHQEMQAFERLAGIARAIRRPGSAALDLAYTARGVFDGFWERNLSAWDVAAGSLLVTEAGGKVTHFDGSPFDVEGKQILASNRKLHPLLQETLSAQLCELPETR